MKIIGIFLISISVILYPKQVIMIMGPSCAGKSTLVKKLKAILTTEHEKWIIVDFDEVGENIENLINTTNNALLQQYNVIIDTNTYNNGLEDAFISKKSTIKIVLKVPLSILLEREAQRTKNLHRTSERAYWCRHFVISSYKESLLWQADLYIDNSQPIEQSIQKIITYFYSIQN